MTPLGFATWRALFGAILLTVVVGILARQGRALVRLRDMPRRTIAALSVAAAAGIILNLAVFIAFGRITIALALLAFYTYPAMVAFVAIVIERRRPDRLELAALGLALGGMTLVVAGQIEPGAGLVIDGLGLGLSLLAAVAQTVYITTSRGYAAIPTEQAAPILLWVAALAFVVIGALGGSLDTLVRALPEPGRLALPARRRPPRSGLPVAPVPRRDPAHRTGPDGHPGDARAGHRVRSWRP